MPTPPLPYKTVTGVYQAPDGSPIAGQLRFVPSATVLDTSGNTVIAAVPILVTLSLVGDFSVALEVTDDPGSTPTGWTWQLSELFPGGRTLSFQIPSTSGSIVHLTDLAPASTVDETWQYATLATVAGILARLTTLESGSPTLTQPLNDLFLIGA